MVNKKFIMAILKGKELIRNGHIVINPIGEALYVDLYRITINELEEIKKLKSEGII